MKKILSLINIILLSTIFCINTISAKFSDVPQTQKNYKAIIYLQENNIVNGYQDGTFKPNKEVKRSEALKMILLGSEIEGEKAQTKPFPDTPITQWYTEYVNVAKVLKIINGNKDGLFEPAKTLNLAGALKIVLKTNEIDTSSIKITIKPFQDIKTDDWFAQYFQYAKQKNIISSNITYIKPAADMTRGDLAEIMYRVAIMNKYQLDKFKTNFLDIKEVVEPVSCGSETKQESCGVTDEEKLDEKELDEELENIFNELEELDEELDDLGLDDFDF